MRFVFVSYARDDLSISSDIRRELIKNNVRVWRDLEDIRKDQGWDVEIESILDSGELTHFLFLETNRSCRKESVCRDEIERAVKNGIPILRLLFEKPNSVPLRVQRKTPIDFRINYQEALKQLFEQLFKAESTIKEPLQSPLDAVERKPTVQQMAVAQDKTPFVRLIAPPGTGKSFVIEERVRWLLQTGADADGIYVVSFTRASSEDLRERIRYYCKANGQPSVSLVHVNTLHSIALKVLRKEGFLDDYPVTPKVLDDWETEHIFDVEMGFDIQRSVARCKNIRLAAEAYWCTGQWDVPPHMQPSEPVTGAEIQAFNAHLEPITQIYACVLPGQIVKKCTDYVDSGLVQPATSLKTQHLIVDEFQDLNYTDTQFVHSFTTQNVPLFVAGDDDQSIYAFRFAYPSGIQQFTNNYIGASARELTECFRCPPMILHIAVNLLASIQDSQRIPKQVVSRYQNELPNAQGVSHRWICKSETGEADAIARTCKKLIASGIVPQDILILLANRKVQLFAKKGSLSALEKAFEDQRVPIELSRLNPYTVTESGRFVYALIRIACDGDLVDYVAHRTLLGLLKGTTSGICDRIRQTVLRNNYNFLDIFYNPFPEAMFGMRERRAIDSVCLLLSEIKDWNKTDSLEQHKQRIASLLLENFDEIDVKSWLEEIQGLPNEITLEEVRHYLEAERDDQRSTILTNIYKRLDLPIPETGFFPPKVRVMTMHGIKGLEAQVVFIPGLELGILPNEKVRKYPGLRLEAARLLYVSITRAKAGIIMSYAKSRLIHGQRDYKRIPSSFVTALGGKFVENNGIGLTDEQVKIVVETVTALRH